jgi:uncharacterized protein (TIGR03086 family)
VNGVAGSRAVLARYDRVVNTNDDVYLRVAKRFGEVLSHVTSDQWDRSTPCDEWTVRDLVTHVIATHRRVYALVDPVGLADVDGEAPLIDQWTVVATTMRDALGSASLADALVPARNGEQPFSQLVGGLLMFDTLCHTWDLARATDDDETLDADAVAIAHERLGAVSDAIRVPGGFAAPIEPASDADAQTRFLNFVGRSVEVR